MSSSRKEPYNLPDARWYVKYCPDNNVKSWSDFVDWCGFVSKGKVPSKEKLIKLIYKLQKDTNRPLLYDDFRGDGCYHPSIKWIRYYWGTINNMKDDLGLEVIQQSMIEKHLSKEKFDNMVCDICNFVVNDNRNFITTREIDNNENWLNADTLQKMSKRYYGCKLQDLLGKYNVYLGKQGNGICFNFDDGEHVTSQFEYMFSKYLKDNGFDYNKDYFRDVNYSSFIKEYNGNMNCDYVIHIKNQIIYVEIAGIIEAYKEWFINDRSIVRSKSKERYRLKLLEKQKMLKENGLHYYILFPCDLTHDNFYNILNNDSISLRKMIESFMKNNIDWKKIREIGELKYTSDIKWGRNIIDYREVV